jgi:hypothetical protein
LSSHPLPPLLLLPPISLSLSLSSSLIAFLIISYVSRPKPKASKHGVHKVNETQGKGANTESLLREKEARVFAERDREESMEAERRREEWEEVESSAAGGLRRLPEERKRGSRFGESTIGGVSNSTPNYKCIQYAGQM